jgi:hypothetical protein
MGEKTIKASMHDFLVTVAEMQGKSNIPADDAFSTDMPTSLQNSGPSIPEGQQSARSRASLRRWAMLSLVPKFHGNQPGHPPLVSSAGSDMLRVLNMHTDY